MLKARLDDDGVTVVVDGELDLGYIGKYSGDVIDVPCSMFAIRTWEEITSRVEDAENAPSEQIIAALDEYLAEVQANIDAKRQKLNDNFLINVFDDMWSCGCEFWKEPKLVNAGKMPEDASKVYGEQGDKMRELFENSDDRNVEAELRELFPMFNMDAFLDGIEPESATIDSDFMISFQCSDKFGRKILLSAYDMFDKDMNMLDWHNF